LKRFRKRKKFRGKGPPSVLVLSVACGKKQKIKETAPAAYRDQEDQSGELERKQEEKDNNENKFHVSSRLKYQSLLSIESPLQLIKVFRGQ